MSKNTNLITAILFFLLFAFPLGYLTIWGLFNDQYTFNVAITFSLIGILAFNIISLYDKGFNNLLSPNFYISSLSFIFGSITYLIVSFFGTITGSVTTFSISNILSTATKNIPPDWYIFVNSVGAGFGEEGLFLGAILIIVLIIQDAIPKRNNLYKSGIFTFFLYNLISIPLFLLYHAGRELTASFIIGGIIFRLIVSSIVVFETTSKKIDLIPSVIIGISFAVGAHITNNLIQLGGLNFSYLFGSVAGFITFMLYFVNLAGTLYFVKKRFFK